MKYLILMLAFVGSAFAADEKDHYVATATTTALTLQQPAGNIGRQITFPTDPVAGATVSCAAAQTATISWNGTAASATAGTEVKLPGTTNSSGMTVWTASNVGSGTTGPAYPISAGVPVSIWLGWFRFGSTGSSTNITITTTGSCTISFFYSAT